MKRLELKDHNTIDELKREIRLSKDGRYSLRVQCILLRKEGLKPKEIERRLLISRDAYRRWIAKYNEYGLQGLKTKVKTTFYRKWDSSLFKELYQELDKNNQWWTIKKMQEFIKNKHNVKIPRESIRRIVKQAGYSWKTSRPTPYKGIKEVQEEFKKNS